MRIAISLIIGWALGFGLYFLGAGWLAPVAGTAASLLAMSVSR